jgi:MFS family permease
MRALGRGDADDTAPPIVAALLLAGGAALLVTGLGAHDLVVTVPLALVGLVLAVAEFRRLTPPGTLFARRGLPAAVAFRGITTFAFFGTDAFLAFSLARLRGFDPIEVGLILTPPTLTWVAGAWIQVRVAGHRSRRSLATIGMTLVAAGVAGTSVVIVHDAPLAVVAVAYAVAGLGMGLSYSPTALVALSEAETGRQGAASSAVLLSDTLGAALGAGIGGAIVAAAPSLAWSRPDALAVVFGLMTVVALLGVAVARRFPPDPANLGSAVPLTSANGETS